MIFCLKIEEFLLFLTCRFKFTTNHESKFASTCKMCFPNTCKTVLCSGNQFPVKIHIFLFFNFVPLFMELPKFVFGRLGESLKKMPQMKGGDIW